MLCGIKGDTNMFPSFDNVTGLKFKYVLPISDVKFFLIFYIFFNINTSAIKLL